MFHFAATRGFPDSSEPYPGFTPPTVEPCIGFPIGFECIGLPVAESPATALTGRSQWFVDPPANTPAMHPFPSALTFYGTADQFDIQQNDADASDSLKRKYLELGQQWGIPDCSHSQPGNPLFGRVAGEPVSRFFDPQVSPAPGQSVFPENSSQPGPQIQKGKRQVITPWLPDWHKIFPEDLDFSELKSLPETFDLNLQTYAAQNINGWP